jgi:TolB-like protein/tetratricopeptide (TPR) repeat protein
MSEQAPQRRLAAILAADVVGYSRMMQADEAGTLAALKSRRTEILQPLVSKHHGRIVKVMGDGVLVEFGSAVVAVICATELQNAMETANAGVPEGKRIVLRIGVNLGDMMVEGTDLYGDGVNVAARLEAIAEPGTVVVSRTVFDHVRGKVKFGFDDLGDQQLKNIAEPVRIYRVQSLNEARGHPMLALPDKPSIAVLPFQNMSVDSEQEYFADGIVEEIITALSRMRWLFVIARNSSFTYKGRAVGVKQIGRELGVRYLLEGSVRKAGNKIRITGQLIDCATSAHLWADRFEGALGDIFDLQDQVTTSVVGAIAPKLEQAEIERSRLKPTESLDAYDYYLRGMAAFNRWTPEGNIEALSMFQRAIELDPQFASAYGFAVRCYNQRKANGWPSDRRRDAQEVAKLAQRAAELGKDDAVALGLAGIGLVWVVGDLEQGAALIERALTLNPNWAWAWLFSGWAQLWLGEPEAAIERLVRAMRLSPQESQMFGMEAAMGWAHFFAGRYQEAMSWAEKALHEQSNYFLALSILAGSCSMAGREAEARSTLESLRRLDPDLRISTLGETFPIRRPEHFARFAQALQKAGLPD